MIHRFGELYVPKMSRACGHVAGTGLTLGLAVHHTLPGVHQPPHLGPPPFHGVGIANAIRDCH